MWIFTSQGFISVVADRDSNDKLLVRARMEGHIQSVFPNAQVLQLDDADYRFRALVSRKAVSRVIAKQIGNIEYDNFKSTVHDPRYHTACMDVWGVMQRLQTPAGRSDWF